MATKISKSSNRMWILVGIAVVLTLVRLWIGFQWFSELGWKAPWEGSGGYGCDSYKFNPPPGQELHGLCDWMQREANQPAIGLYGDFVRNVVIPNFGLFAPLSFLTETFITFSLLFGFLTRLGGLVGGLWAVSLLIGLVGIPGESAPFYLTFIVVSGLFGVIGARYQFSVDSVLAKNYDKLGKKNRLGKLLKLATGAQPGSAGVL
jgi:hypothetical protein